MTTSASPPPPAAPAQEPSAPGLRSGPIALSLGGAPTPPPKKPSKGPLAVLGVVAGLGLGFGLAQGVFGPTTPPTISPPASIDSTCGTDVTAPLNTWLATVPDNTTVTFAPTACYLVSGKGMQVVNVSHVTLNGQGAMIRQTHYDVGTNLVEPLVNLENTTNLEVENLNLVGPGNAGGENNEGDYGFTIAGNTAALITHVSVSNVDGDNYEVWADNDTNCGVANVNGDLNNGVTISNSTFTNPGYHGGTVQGVVGFTFANNTSTGGNDAVDIEFDGTQAWCNGKPVAGGEANLLYSHNVYTNSGNILFEVGQARGNTILANNWSFIDNTAKGTAVGQQIGMGCQCVGGVSDQAGDPSTGLTLLGNKQTGFGMFSSVGASPIQGQAHGGAIQVVDWNNVNIENNSGAFWNGTPTYLGFAYSAFATLNNVHTAIVKNNVGSGAAAPWSNDATGTIWSPPGAPPNPIPSTGVTACGNRYGYNNPDANGVGTIPPPLSDSPC